MKFSLISLLFILLLGSEATSQKLIPFYKEGKYGYKNINGQIVIDPSFDYVQLFGIGKCDKENENQITNVDLAYTETNNQGSFINNKGEHLIPVDINASITIEKIVIAKVNGDQGEKNHRFFYKVTDYTNNKWGLYDSQNEQFGGYNYTLINSTIIIPVQEKELLEKIDYVTVKTKKDRAEVIQSFQQKLEVNWKLITRHIEDNKYYLPTFDLLASRTNIKVREIKGLKVEIRYPETNLSRVRSRHNSKMIGVVNQQNVLVIDTAFTDISFQGGLFICNLRKFDPYKTTKEWFWNCLDAKVFDSVGNSILKKKYVHIKSGRSSIICYTKNGGTDVYDLNAKLSYSFEKYVDLYSRVKDQIYFVDVNSQECGIINGALEVIQTFNADQIENVWIEQGDPIGTMEVQDFILLKRNGATLLAKRDGSYISDAYDKTISYAGDSIFIAQNWNICEVLNFNGQVIQKDLTEIKEKFVDNQKYYIAVRNDSLVVFNSKFIRISDGYLSPRKFLYSDISIEEKNGMLALSVLGGIKSTGYIFNKIEKFSGENYICTDTVNGQFAMYNRNFKLIGDKFFNTKDNLRMSFLREYILVYDDAGPGLLSTKGEWVMSPTRFEDVRIYGNKIAAKKRGENNFSFYHINALADLKFYDYSLVLTNSHKIVGKIDSTLRETPYFKQMCAGDPIKSTPLKYSLIDSQNNLLLDSYFYYLDYSGTESGSFYLGIKYDSIAGFTSYLFNEKLKQIYKGNDYKLYPAEDETRLYGGNFFIAENINEVKLISDEGRVIDSIDIEEFESNIDFTDYFAIQVGDNLKSQVLFEGKKIFQFQDSADDFVDSYQLTLSTFIVIKGKELLILHKNGKLLQNIRFQENLFFEEESSCPSESASLTAHLQPGERIILLTSESGRKIYYNTSRNIVY